MADEPNLKEDGAVATDIRQDVRMPPLFKVLLHNDDYTTQEFVVYILEAIFRHAPQEAREIMLRVHRRGIGVAGLFPHEIAEAKVAQAHDLARANEFPLKCSVEAE